MGINYKKIEDTVNEIIQLEGEIEKNECEYEQIPIKPMSATEVLNKINSGGYVYNIKGGIDALRKLAEQESCDKEWIINI